MFNRIAPQAAAFVLSAVATLAMFGGVDHLALQQLATSTVATATDGATAQHVVVVTARHAARG